MASDELIIDDDYCRTMGSYFIKHGEELDQLIADYIAIIQEVKNKGIMSGDVSNALSSYIDYVKKLDKKIGNISISARNQIEKFLSRIDTEDRYLF